MHKKKYIGIFIGTLGTIFLFSGLLLADTIKQSIHGNKALLPAGCGSCHKGHGVKGTPLLPLAEKDFCFFCHGSQSRQSEAMKARKLSKGKILKDISEDFKKVYHHPIEEQGIHNSREVLPETDSSTPRHATCVDCHNPHRVKKDKLTAGITGAKRGALKGSFDQYSKAAEVEEYEICYKCHSYSMNLPGDQKNKEEEFDPQNMSYHPVEDQKRNNSRVPSLIPSAYTNTTSRTIKCSDCHGADGHNAVKGTHGSKYKHILKSQYEVGIYSIESKQNYELCYGCHRRETLLLNGRFTHGNHVNRTSCKTCHNSHGSRNYPYLIDFNPLAVSANINAKLEFEMKEYMATCQLKCHNRDHVLENFETKVIIPQ